MSAAKAKKAAPAKAGKATVAATQRSDQVHLLNDRARAVARGLFELSEDSAWRGDVTKALRLAFDLGAELAKLQESAERRLESAKWQDRQPDLPLDEDDED